MYHQMLLMASRSPNNQHIANNLKHVFNLDGIERSICLYRTWDLHKVAGKRDPFIATVRFPECAPPNVRLRYIKVGVGGCMRHLYPPVHSVAYSPSPGTKQVTCLGPGSWNA